MPYPQTKELIEKYGERLKNGNLKKNELQALNKEFSDTLNNNPEAKSDAINDFVQAIAFQIPKRTLGTLIVQLLNLEEKWMYAPSLAITFLAYVAANFPGLSRNIFAMPPLCSLSPEELEQFNTQFLKPAQAVFTETKALKDSATDQKDSSTDYINSIIAQNPEHAFLFNLISDKLRSNFSSHQNLINKRVQEFIDNEMDLDTFLFTINPIATGSELNLHKSEERLKIRYLVALHSLETTVNTIKNSDLKSKTNQLIRHVQDLKGKEPMLDLVQSLESTNALLTGNMLVKDYKKQAKKLEGSPSIVLQVLGGLMAAIGLLAMGVGIGLATTGIGVVSGVLVGAGGAALVAAGTAFFAKGSKKTGLSKNVSDVAEAKDKESDPDSDLTL